MPSQLLTHISTHHCPSNMDLRQLTGRISQLDTLRDLLRNLRAACRWMPRTEPRAIITSNTRGDPIRTQQPKHEIHLEKAE